MKKDQIRKNFSKHAATYDKYSGIQKHIAQNLADMMPDEMPLTALDVGCGTGHLTKMLRMRYSGCLIKAVDLSLEMINLAKNKLGDNVDFVETDAEKINEDERYDLIASNAAMQWFFDTGKAIARFSGMLNSNGNLIFSAFGPLTYHELSWAMSEALGKKIGTSSKDFLGKPELDRILTKNFKKHKIREEIIKDECKSLKELLAKIKFTGTRGSGTLGAGLIGKETLKKAEEVYLKKYGKIVATHQVFYCEGNA